MGYNDKRYAFKKKIDLQTQWVLTECGLYRYLLESRSGAATALYDWFFFSVIPALRATKTAMHTAFDTGECELHTENHQITLKFNAIHVKEVTPYSADNSQATQKHAGKWIDSMFPALSWNKVQQAVRVQNDSERQVVNKLQGKLGGNREYEVKGGRIDLLTASEIIEVAEASLFKQAIGQVLYYAHVLADDGRKRTPRVHLFNRDDTSVCREDIVAFGKSLNVNVTFE